MKKLHKKYPQYGWDKNKGYGTAVHRAAIAEHGLCQEHRKSFKILPHQLDLL
jgi:ribonuclease HII